jgi:hypothetical protein
VRITLVTIIQTVGDVRSLSGTVERMTSSVLPDRGSASGSADVVFYRFGIAIKKTSIPQKELDKLKKTMLVSPFVIPRYKQMGPVKKFPVFRENDTHLVIPKYFSQKFLALAKKNVKIKTNEKLPKQRLTFNGKMRPEQVPAVEETLRRLGKQP